MRLFILSFFCLCCFSMGFAANGDLRINEILVYWLGDLQGKDDYPHDRSEIWFNGGPEVDQEIRNRFEHLVRDAANHQLDDWKQTPRGRLALIILLDQFTRNIYRGTSEAFAFDAIAQELTLEGLDLEIDNELFPVEKIFFYLPLEHAENLQLQEKSIEKFNQLSASVHPSLSSIFKTHADYAWRHYKIILKFGRFPHRNAMMGRESTDDEMKFLTEPNSSF